MLLYTNDEARNGVPGVCYSKGDSDTGWIPVKELRCDRSSSTTSCTNSNNSSDSESPSRLNIPLTLLSLESVEALHVS